MRPTILFRLMIVLLGPLPLLVNCLSSTKPATLLTFDVDGTLVQGKGRAAAESVHARAFAHAVSTLYNNQQPVTPVAQALPRRLYHGSTDGLILLRHVQATVNNKMNPASIDLDALMECMYQYVMGHDDDAITEHIQPLPGVLDHLRTLSNMQKSSQDVFCGLVTGNVEGIARRKMEAVGILDTDALSPPCPDSQLQKWPETAELAFLGGFGSDYCSKDLNNLDRNYLDRAEQIAICARRCRNVMKSSQSSDDDASAVPTTLRRVVHVGDAPADVLAAKAFYQQEQRKDDAGKLTVGMVAVATGSYPASELQELCGDPVPGQWEPVVLEDGMASPNFLRACGVVE